MSPFGHGTAGLSRISWVRTQMPSPPFRGEREGPIAKRWEGEVGARRHLWNPHLTLPSPPPGAEREMWHLFRPSLRSRQARPAYPDVGIRINRMAAKHPQRARDPNRIAGCIIDIAMKRQFQTGALGS